MLNLDSQGRPIAKIISKQNDNQGTLIYLNTDDDIKCSNTKCKGFCKSCISKIKGEDSIKLNKQLVNLLPIPKLDEREVMYIAGPSGSGKSSHAAKILNLLQQIFPEKNIYGFSRTNLKDDPAYKDIKISQISLDESLIENPIDINREIKDSAIILFDDCNTIQSDSLKKTIEKLIMDILEVGRKLNIWIILTNHLVIPNERKLARTILNEIQSFTFFPKSGTSQQISYCLKNYFGLDAKKIREILSIDSRWVTIYKNYPMYVIYDSGVYIL